MFWVLPTLFYITKSRVCFEKRNCKNDLVQLEACDSVFLKHVQFRTGLVFFHGPPNSAWICKINVGSLCLSSSVTNCVGSSVVRILFTRIFWSQLHWGSAVRRDGCTNWVAVQRRLPRLRVYCRDNKEWKCIFVAKTTKGYSESSPALGGCSHTVTFPTVLLV